MTAVSPETRTGFSTELSELAGRLDRRQARLADVLAATRSRGYHLLLLVLTLPFVGPIPLPGFSIPFGAAVFVFGLRLVLHRQPWLPARLLHLNLPSRYLARTLQGASRIVRMIEAFARPRWLLLSERAFFQRLAGLLICFSGLFLILPLPLPFSNSLPAWTVIFLSVGAVTRDGLFLLAGALAFGLSTAFFALVAIGGRYAVEHLLPWFTAG
jgi:hypothetical protein